MSIVEIKAKIAELSREERDDVMGYIKLLQQDSDLEITPDLETELNMRLDNHDKNPSASKQWRDVLHIKSL